MGRRGQAGEQEGEGGRPTLMIVLIVAAVLGNTVNYAIGRHFGPRVFQWENSRFFNQAALQKTHAFYEVHGGKTLIISRFLPLLRTFAPFVAGMGHMAYLQFARFNVLGAVLWVCAFCYAGYLFGNMPVVKSNLSLLILGIIVVSILPGVIEIWRQRRGAA